MSEIEGIRRKIGLLLWDGGIMLKQTDGGYAMCFGDTMYDITITERE